VTNHIQIEEIAAHEGQEVTLQGWLYNKTGKGKLQFLQVRDGTGIVQCVLFKGDVSEEVFEAARALTQESSLRLTGTVRKDDRAPGVPGGYEVGVSTFETLQIAEPYPITPKEHGVEFLLDHRHLWLRSSRQWATLRIRAAVIAAIRGWLDDHGYLNVDTPIITPTAGENTTSLFEVDYFDEPGYLARPGSFTTRPTSWPSAKSTASAPPSAPKNPKPAATWPSSGWSNPKWPSLTSTI
jgi:asparaginyl-tRNA synthetase